MDYLTLTQSLIAAWQNRKHDKPINYLFYLSFASAILGLLLTIGYYVSEAAYSYYFGIGLLGLAFVSIRVISDLQKAKDANLEDAKIQKLRDDVRKDPKKTQTAWELASIKLESYLNRNLSQVRWIFIWTVIVMFIGFGIVGYGIFLLYKGDTTLEVSILATVSGIITEIIGATFLILYKSTLHQAKDYVNVLERINAVGMSIQILDTISDKNNELKDKTKSELSKELLMLYSKQNK